MWKIHKSGSMRGNSGNGTCAIHCSLLYWNGYLINQVAIQGQVSTFHIIILLNVESGDLTLVITQKGAEFTMISGVVHASNEGVVPEYARIVAERVGIEPTLACRTDQQRF